MAKVNKAKIREAILANRGGFARATEGQIMTIWNSLDAETQKKYLGSLEAHKTVETKKTKDDGKRIDHEELEGHEGKK